MSRVTPSIEENFEIVSVKPAETPDGMEGDDWHCYKIAQGPNIIKGYRQGSIRPVTEAAQEIVNQLNERRLGKRARAELAKARAAEAAAKK